MKDDYTTNSSYLTHTFLCKRSGECTFWISGSERVNKCVRYILIAAITLRFKSVQVRSGVEGAFQWSSSIETSGAFQSTSQLEISRWILSVKWDKISCPEREKQSTESVRSFAQSRCTFSKQNKFQSTEELNGTESSGRSGIVEEKDNPQKVPATASKSFSSKTFSSNRFFSEVAGVLVEMESALLGFN